MHTKLEPRALAWRILRSGSTTPLREVDGAAARAGLEPRDRGLLRKLVGSEVRRRGTLRALVARFARGQPSADLATHLRLGLVQLFFLDRVPVHAAVSETVGATRDTLGMARGRYVNGVLREVLRARRAGSCGDPRRDLVQSPWHFDEPILRDPERHPALWAEDALSIPAALMKRWIARHGRERALELGLASLDEGDPSLRVVRGQRDALIGELREQGLEPLPADHPRILRVPGADIASLVGSEAFAGGRFAFQGETALRAAELLEVREGEHVLDLCAAPGGKAAVLAAAGARVTALDLSPGRLARIAPELERLALAGAVRCVASDGTSGLGQASFDGVLVDAPCSNTAVLGRRPGARWRFGPASQRDLVALQTRLLEQAAPRVRPGGRLVYSTCSLEPEENGQAVRGFLERHPGWELEVEIDVLPARLGAGPVDGGFAARLRRPLGD